MVQVLIYDCRKLWNNDLRTCLNLWLWVDFKSLEYASISPWEFMSRFCCELWTNKCQGWKYVHANTHGKICKGVLEATALDSILGGHRCAQLASNASTWF